jgi:hypothetical protein
MQASQAQELECEVMLGGRQALGLAELGPGNSQHPQPPGTGSPGPAEYALCGSD